MGETLKETNVTLEKDKCHTQIEFQGNHMGQSFHRCPEHGLANRNTTEQLWHTTICF